MSDSDSDYDSDDYLFEPLTDRRRFYGSRCSERSYAERIRGLCQYDDDQSERMALDGVKLNQSLEDVHIKNKTKEVCAAAILRWPYQVSHVESRSHWDNVDDLHILAIIEDTDAFISIKSPSKAVCAFALSKDGLLLKYIENKSTELSLIAVNQNGMALEYVDNKLPIICLKAVEKNGMALEYCDIMNTRIVETALNNDDRAIQCGGVGVYYDLCLKYIKKNGMLLELIKDEDKDLNFCISAIVENIGAIKYVDAKYRDECDYLYSRHYTTIFKLTMNEICFTENDFDILPMVMKMMGLF